jgi:hypothetical protein
VKVRFWASDKPRERILAEAFVTGVKAFGDQADTRSLGEEITPDCDVAVMVGVKSKELWRAHQRMGVQLIYLDKGYDRHDRGDGSRVWEYWRCAVNAHQPTAKFRPDYPTDRMEAFEWEFKPWRKSGSHVLIAGSSAKYHSFYDLKEPNDYWRKAIKQMNTKRFIVYRPKPSWKEAQAIEGTEFHHGPNMPGIDDDLKNAHVLVTHGSNACFEAMLAGVPSIVIGDAVAKPISSTELTDIEKPRLASDAERKALLAFLSYHQFTMEEMCEGIAWRTLRQEIFR